MFTGIRKFMNGSMQNKNSFLFFLLSFLLISCNIPYAYNKENTLSKPEKEFLWNLGEPSFQNTAGSSFSTNIPEKPTATPQLIKALDFEAAFAGSREEGSHSASENHPIVNNGKDEAKWLYFSPGEYSTSSFDTLYAAFENSGESFWDDNYFLDFYAGTNPSSEDEIRLLTTVYPGEQAVFEIPITKEDASWKACWQLKNANAEPFYDFCYSHGSGINSPQAASAAVPSSSSNSDVFWGFVRTEGSAPARFSSSELNGEFISTSPASGHIFDAYDHYEDLTVTFKNNGTTTWDSSYAVVFYSGYNWMHSNSFRLPDSVNPGDTATVIMPMDIIEDNDRWVTCWYLATPDGKNLADFCFNYRTG